VLELDLGDIQLPWPGPSGAGRIELPQLKEKFVELFQKPVSENGYNKPKEALSQRFALPNGNRPAADVGHGDVLIAAITSCTNTSNPSVMLAAGLLARKAVEKGLTVRSTVKSSLAPGSRVVTDYLRKTGLQPYLDRLGFQLVGYGCTTCIGNSGPLEARIEEVVTKNDLIAANMLSGNRNFEAFTKTLKPTFS
jgi:aconitate hydratase